MGKSVIQRMYMEYIKENTMNEQERALDLQLGDALAEIESLKAERDALKANRDEYQVAADKLAWECKVLRDAAQAGLDALIAMQSYAVAENKGLRICDESITQLQAALEVDPCPLPEQDIADILAGELQISRATAYDLMREALAKAQPEQEKPWVGLTEEEHHIAEVLNKPLGLRYVADKLQEKNKMNDKDRVFDLQAQPKHEIQNEEKALELQGLVKEFFEKYLNRVEESDGGKEFHPITVSCCRVMMSNPLDALLDKMSKLSGAEPNPLLHKYNR